MEQKKGCKKIGGRKKGIPNKANRPVKEAINNIILGYVNSDLFAQDYASLEPKDRLLIADKLMQYSVPKMASVEVDSTSEVTITIEDRLKELSGK